MKTRHPFSFALLALVVALVAAMGGYAVARAAETKTFRVENKTRRDVRVEIYTADAWAKSEGSKKSNYGSQDEADHKEFNDGLRIVIVPAGESVEVALEQDKTFYYAYRVCGKDVADVIDGELVMKKDITLTIYPCASQKTTMQVKNHLGKTISLELIGYEDETFEIPPGFSTIEVFSGETIYKYDACDRDFNGVVDILPNGTTQFYLYSCEWYDSPDRVYGAANVADFRLINHASFPIILSLVGPENYLLTVNPGENRVRLVVGVYKYSYFMDFQQVTGTFFVSPNGNGIAMFSPAYTIDNGLLDETTQE